MWNYNLAPKMASLFYRNSVLWAYLLMVSHFCQNIYALWYLRCFLFLLLHPGKVLLPPWRNHKVLHDWSSPWAHSFRFQYAMGFMQVFFFFLCVVSEFWKTEIYLFYFCWTKKKCLYQINLHIGIINCLMDSGIFSWKKNSSKSISQFIALTISDRIIS